MKKFDIYAWADGFPRASEAWADLAARQALNPSVGPEWVDLSLRAHGYDRGASLLVATEGDRMRAVVPLLTRTLRLLGTDMRALEVGSNLTAYHPSLVTDGCEDEVADSLLEKPSGAPWDIFVFRSAVSPGPTLSALRAAARKRGLYCVELPGHRSPYLPIRESFSDFLAGKSSNFRYNLQRKKKKFLKVPGARLEWVQAGQDLNAVLARMLAIEAASWKAEQGVAVNQNDAERRYYEQLLPMLAAKNALVMNLLSVGEVPVAYTLCCRSGDWIGLLKTSFKQQFGSTAAGNYSLNEAVGLAFELQVAEFDFLGGEDSYKLEWAPSVRQHVDFMCFGKTLRGRAVGALAALRRRFRPDRPQASVGAEGSAREPEAD